MKLRTPSQILQLFKLSDFVCLDFETTGLDPQNSVIIEAAAVRIKEGKVTDKYHSLVSFDGELPEAITNLTGITDADLVGQPTMETVIFELVEFIGDSTIAAHNLAFDLGFLEEMIIRMDDPSLAHHINFKNPAHIDSLLLARILLPRLRAHNLEFLIETFGIKTDTQHRALEDVMAEIQVLDKLLIYLFELPNITLAQLTTATSGYSGFISELLHGLKEYRTRKDAFADLSLPKVKFDYPESANIYYRKSNGNGRLPLPMDANEVASIFDENGILAKSLKSYEFREEQIEMAREICLAYNNEQFLMIEAGTGTGKSWAYLVPAIFWSQLHPPPNGRTVISTNTKNLQDQIFYKDLPFLHKYLPVDFQAVVLKGRHNYICLHRWEKFLANLDFAKDLKTIEEILPLIVWVNETSTGDIEECSSFNPNHSIRIWLEIRSDGHYCKGMACPAKDRCFINKVRRASREADIVVVNHALLLSDLISDMAILSEYQNLVIDEAQNLEDTATQYFGLDWSDRMISQFVAPLVNETGETRNEVNRLSNLLKQQSWLDGSVLSDCLTSVNRVRNTADTLRINDANFFQSLREEIIANQIQPSNYAIKVRYKNFAEAYPKVQKESQDLLKTISQLESELELLNRNLHEIAISQFNEDHKLFFEDLCIFFLGAYDNILGWRNALNRFLVENREDEILWIEYFSKKENLNIHFRSAPLEVAPLLKERLYSRLSTAIFTSATLSIDDSFAFFEQRLGIDLLPYQQRQTKILGSSFDYDSQIRVLVPSFIPNPRHPQFVQECSDIIQDVVMDSRRGTLVLFTSYKMLDEVFGNLNPNLRSQNIIPLAQGKSGSRNNLLRMFRERKAHILFGTQSFWEGIDVPGEALEMLIITKIPFEVPSDPVAQARSDIIEQAGGNSFYDYSVPNAVLKFRQGIGRLIRSKSDRGIVLLLDTRMVSSRYGSIFLNSLPVTPEIISERQVLLERIHDWFDHETILEK